MLEHANATENACSLTDEEFRARRELARKSLLPHIFETKKLESGLKVTFLETDMIRSRVETFVSLERQCCGFLTFTVTPPEEGLTLTIEGPPEAEVTLEMFAAAVKPVSDKACVNHIQSDLGKGVRRTGVAGIAVGVTALLACELPLILGLIGLGGLSTAAVAFRPSFVVEVAGIVIGGIGVLILISLGFRNLWSKKKSVQSC